MSPHGRWALTWQGGVHQAPHLASAAPHRAAHHLAPAALPPAAVVQDPRAADLVAGGGVGHPAAARVAEPHGNALVLRVGTADFTCGFRTRSVIAGLHGRRLPGS